MRSLPCALLALALAAPATAGERRPRLDLRASPRMAMSPVNVLVMARLEAGVAHEDFHCPALEWQWDDGSRSVHESDCEPFEGEPLAERVFSAEHAYRAPGVYNVKVTMRRASRALAVASTTIMVR